MCCRVDRDNIVSRMVSEVSCSEDAKKYDYTNYSYLRFCYTLAVDPYRDLDLRCTGL